MTLMDRIKVKSFLSFTSGEKYNFIEALQLKRTNDQIKAREDAAKGKVRGKKTRTKKVKDPQAEALKILSKLSPLALKQLTAKVI